MKKKVLHVISSVSAGGIESLVVELLDHIDREHFAFEFAVFNPNQPLHQERLESLGARVHFISTAGCSDALASRILWRLKAVWNYTLLVSRNRYDVLHCHNFENFGPYVLIAALRGIPVRIVHSHRAGHAGESVLSRVARHLKNALSLGLLVTHKVGCSQAAAEWLFGTTDRARVIYNGIDMKKFAPGRFSRAEVRARYDLANGIHLLSVGRFSKQKNQLFLLEVFDEMSGMRDDVYLTLVGFGPLEASIRAKAASLDASGTISFLPADTDVEELLAGVDCLLLPSLWEGLPIVAVEAQCAGVPVVMSAAVTEEVDIGLTERLPRDADAKCWARHILQTIDCPGHRRKIVPERAWSFDMRNVAREFEALYGGCEGVIGEVASP